MVEFDRANLILVLLFLCFFADLRICEKVETSDKENADVSWFFPMRTIVTIAWTGPLSWQVVSLILSGFHSNARGWNWWPPLRSSLGKCMVWAKAIYIYTLIYIPRPKNMDGSWLSYCTHVSFILMCVYIIYNNIYIYIWMEKMQIVAIYG